MRRLVVPPVLVAAPFLAMAVRLALAHRDPVLSGDHALLDLGVLDASRLHGSLGPYSRYGFSHPGPALFYLLAPVMLATGRAPWALHLGVQLLYAATAAALVGVVGRRAGPAATAGATLAVLAWVALLRPTVLAVPWNPLVIILPAALLLVASAAVERPGSALALVALVGTFLVQTHVGTALLVGGTWLVALALALVGRRPATPSPSRARRVALGLALATGLLWVPPVFQQLTHHPGNAGRLLHFFLAEHHEPAADPLGAAVLVGREVDTSRGSIPFLGTPTPATVGRTRSLAALGVLVVLAVTLLAVGSRRGEPFAARLGVASLVGAVMGVVSVTGIVGETYWYLLAWTSAAVVPLVVGWVVLATRRRAPALPLIGAVLASLALTAATLSQPLYDSPAFPEEPRYRAGVREAWALVDPLVDTTGADSVAFQAASEAPSPTIAGLAVRLERRGVHTAVSDNLVHIYGDRHRQSGREDLRVAVLDPGANLPPAGAIHLGRAAGFDFYVLK